MSPAAAALRRPRRAHGDPAWRRGSGFASGLLLLATALSACGGRRPGQASGSPVIHRIDGSGEALAVAPRPEDQAVIAGTPDPRLAEHRIASDTRELLITGDRLSDPRSVRAVGLHGQGAIDFEIQPGGNDTMLAIRFPATLAVTAGGLFLLTLTTGQGTAEAQVFFLQGQDGTCANPVNGDLVVTGTITAGAATVGRLEVTGSYSLPPCPGGYEEDTSAFGGAYPEVHVCVHPATSDELVQVGDFWIDRYEASLWAEPSCSGAQFGAGDLDDYPAGFPDTGHVTTPLYACSVPGVIPSRNLTWFQAAQACAAQGKRLCANDEWQAAAAGTHDPGSAESSPSQCRVAAANSGPRRTGQVGATPASPDHCVSRYGAEDLAGNLAEWTAAWYVGGHDWTPADGYNEATNVWGAEYGDDSTYSINGSAYHPPSGQYQSGIPGAGSRGGAWNFGAQAGVFMMAINSSPARPDAALGLRCCRSR